MHDAAADYCDYGGGGRRGAAKGGGGKDGEITSLADLERSDFMIPAQRTRAFYCERPECSITAKTGGLGISPQIQVADTDHRVCAQTYGHPGLLE